MSQGMFIFGGIMIAFVVLLAVGVSAEMSLAGYSSFTQNRVGNDTYGNGITNHTAQMQSVEGSMAPVMITVSGYETILAAIAVIVACGLALAIFVIAGSRKGGNRR